MSGGTISYVPTMTVTLPDGTTGQYVIEEEREDGSLVIRRRTELEQVLERQGTRAMPEEEFETLIAPHVQPPDGEG